MRLGFHSIHFSPVFGGNAPLSDVVAGAAAAGFRYIGLDLPAIDAEVASGGSVETIAGLLAVHDLSCTDLVVLAITADDDAALADARRIAAIADVVGAGLCVVAVPDPMAWPRIVDSTRRSADVLWDHGVRLAVEFTPYIALSTLHQATDLCDAVGWDRAGLLLDSLHFFRGATSWDELHALDGAQIALLQISDAAGAPPENLMDESRHGRLLPGAGDLPLAAFAAAIAATGFDGPLTAEVLSADLRRRHPETVAQLVRESLVALWPEADAK